MAKNKRLPEGDDGHTIVPMNVEGMPGYRAPLPGEETSGDSKAAPQGTPLTKEETRWWIFGSLKAALLIGGIFALVVVVFAGLLVLIW